VWLTLFFFAYFINCGIAALTGHKDYLEFEDSIRRMRKCIGYFFATIVSLSLAFANLPPLDTTVLFSSCFILVLTIDRSFSYSMRQYFLGLFAYIAVSFTILSLKFPFWNTEFIVGRDEVIGFIGMTGSIIFGMQTLKTFSRIYGEDTLGILQYF